MPNTFLFPRDALISAPTPIVLSFLLDPEKRVFLYSHVVVYERTMNIRFVPNTLYYGDRLDVMADLENRYIDLICLDPPFNCDLR